jgi:hypothetical protein
MPEYSFQLSKQEIPTNKQFNYLLKTLPAAI